MENLRENLQKRILELEEGTKSLIEFFSPETEITITDVNLGLAIYANMVKYKTILEIYNQNFQEPEMKYLEQEVENELDKMSGVLIERLKD